MPRRRSTLSTRGRAPTIVGLFTAEDLRRAVADESSAPSFGQVSMSLTELAWRTMIYSSGRVGTTLAIRGGAPFRRAFLVGFGQSPPHALGIEVVGIDWCAGLLPPGLIQTSGSTPSKPSSSTSLRTVALAAGSSQATGRAMRSAAPLGRPNSGGALSTNKKGTALYMGRLPAREAPIRQPRENSRFACLDSDEESALSQGLSCAPRAHGAWNRGQPLRGTSNLPYFYRPLSTISQD